MDEYILMATATNREKGQLIKFANHLGFKLLYQGPNRWSIHDQNGKQIYPEHGSTSHDQAFDFLYCMARLFENFANQKDFKEW